MKDEDQYFLAKIHFIKKNGKLKLLNRQLIKVPQETVLIDE